MKSLAFPQFLSKAKILISEQRTKDGEHAINWSHCHNPSSEMTTGPFGSVSPSCTNKGPIDYTHQSANIYTHLEMPRDIFNHVTLIYVTMQLLNQPRLKCGGELNYNLLKHKWWHHTQEKGTCLTLNKNCRVRSAWEIARALRNSSSYPFSYSHTASGVMWSAASFTLKTTYPTEERWSWQGEEST